MYLLSRKKNSATQAKKKPLVQVYYDYFKRELKLAKFVNHKQPLPSRVDIPGNYTDIHFSELNRYHCY